MSNKLKKHLHYLQKDPSGEIFFIFYKLRTAIVRFFSSQYCRLKLRVWGVKLGKGLRCGGILTVHRAQRSTISIGKHCVFNSSSLFNFRGINHRCIIQTGTPAARIIIGDNCGFSGVSIVADNEVVLDDNVTVGANAIIGDRDDHSEIYNSAPRPVHIGKNVWLGMNVTVMKGVTIGENTIIGANSIVTKDIPANVIAAGNPCRVLKQIHADKATIEVSAL